MGFLRNILYQNFLSNLDLENERPEETANTIRDVIRSLRLNIYQKGEIYYEE